VTTNRDRPSLAVRSLTARFVESHVRAYETATDGC